MTATAPPLDWVSPLPPVRSGISDYAVDLLPALAAHLAATGDDPDSDPDSLRVVAVPGQTVDPALASRLRASSLRVASADSDPPAGRGGRLALWHMGNNRHHAAIHGLALETPGVVVLHDLVLHHLVTEETLGERDFDRYRERLEADHGWIGREAARPRAWGAEERAALFELAAHRTLLRRQRGVIVHSTWAARTLTREDPDLTVRAVPMGIPLPAPADEAAGRALRRRFGLPEKAPVLGSFGFQTPIKRTDRLVRALARPGLENVWLLVVGESPSGESLLDLAAEVGVADRVVETGFLPFEDFEAAIAACTLCSNLRYPTAGETSASLLRVLAVGRPALVSDHAQFATGFADGFPEDVVVRVPVDEDPAVEAEAAAVRVRELLAAPERLEAMGRAARELVARRHAPERAAAALVEAAGELATRRPPGDRPAAPATPTSLTWGHPRGEITVAPDDLAAWAPGERRRLAVTLTNRGRERWLAAGRGAGGVAVAVRLERPGDGASETGASVDAPPWVPLPRDVEPGASCTLEIPLRRPPGPARLRLEPTVLGGFGFAALGGPVWEGSLGDGADESSSGSASDPSCDRSPAAAPGAGP